MRIGIFTDAYLPQIGGVSTSCLMLKNRLTQKGHKVHIFTTTDPGAAEESKVIRVPSMPFVSAKRVALNYSAILGKRLDKLKLDIVHTQTEFGMGLFGRSFAKTRHIPHVHTYHTIYEDWISGQVHFKPLRHVARNFVRRLSLVYCNSADYVLVPTVKTEKLLKQYGVTKPIEIVPTGIELASFDEAAADAQLKQNMRSRYVLPEDAFVVLYLGRISQEKGIDEVLRYLSSALLSEPKLYFVLVGDGPSRHELMRYVQKTGLTEKVRFTGAVALAEVPKYYAMADVFTSGSTSETQGLTYIEAMASHLPLLVRRDDCLTDILSESENGFGFDDSEDFAAALSKLIHMEADEYKAMSLNAAQKAGGFSVEAFGNRVEKIYEQLLAEFKSR